VTIGVALVTILGGTAGASQRFVAIGDDLALRSGPGTGFPVLARIGAGTPLDIECQLQGATAVNGNSTWDRLVDGRWVADAYTNTPSRNSFAPGLGPCDATPGVTTAPDRAGAAASWAEGRVGQVGTADNPNAGWWSGWCETLVERAWASAGVGFRYPNAASHYRERLGAGQVRTTGAPPRGAVVFYAPNHVAISIGNGRIVTTTGKEGERRPVSIQPYSWMSSYLGWALPR
jgi:hypothetical protein